MNTDGDPTSGPSTADDRPDDGRTDGGSPRGRKHLKREALLSRLFPQEVMRPKLGRYDVLEFIGEGGMGTVFAAYDPQLDRRVAVKLLKKSARANPERRARLLREAKTLARLSHSNIVTIHEVWEEEGEVHLAMEYIQGEDLARWQRGPKPWREVLEVYRQAGEGLAAVHAAGLVYRDFKPHNAIRREEDGIIKLLDFGLARIEGLAVEDEVSLEDEDAGASPSPDHLTRPGAIMGTLAYMAPEQLQGKPADARSDQFSFAVSLWEALHGQRPFVREPAILSGEIQQRELALERDHGVPSWVRRVVERGLAPDPAQRHPSMQALLRELGRDPAARRRRALLAAVLVSSTVGGGLAIAELRAEPSTSCVEVRTSWDDERRDAVQRGVQAAGGAVAEETWGLLAPRLDAYAQEQSSMRRQACEGHRRSLVPDEHYAAQVACLDRREAGFGELVERLAQADPTAVSNANKAVTQLPSVSSCDDIDRLLAEVPPPEDPDVAAEVATLRQELARSAAEESAGLLAEAATRAEAVLGRVDALGYEPLRAEALVRRGNARMQQGDGDSLADFDGALWSSLVTEQRQVAAEAAAKRIFARVELRDRDADVTEEIALAEALSARSGAADWATRWALANNIGVVAERHGQPDEAISAYERALAELPARSGEGTFERAVTLMNMTPILLFVERSEEAVGRSRRATEEFTALFGAAHPQVLKSLVAEAKIHRKLGHYAQARAIISDVLGYYTPQDPPSSWTMLEAIQIAWEQGDARTAQRWCREGIEGIDDDDPRAPMLVTFFSKFEAQIAATEGNSEVFDGLEEAGVTLDPLDRADVLLDLGRAAEAEALASSVLAQPDVAPLLRSVAELLVGRALVMQQRWADARQRLMPLTEGGEGRRLDPLLRLRLLLALAEAEAGAGRSGAAEERVEQAMALLEGFDRDSRPVREAEAVAARVKDAATAP